MKVFIFPLILSAVAFAVTYWVGGMGALMLVLFLTVLEVSLSFDNAVVNAKVLTRMDEAWRKRFLTWGMLIAVFGARIVLPILLVALATSVSPWYLVQLIFSDAEAYAHLVENAAPIIHALGGAFLAMVALKYFFNRAKEVHWIPYIEKTLSSWGKIHAVEVAIVLVALLMCTLAAPAHASQILGAGCIGIVLFILMEGVVEMLGKPGADVSGHGLAFFLYLNLLDAAFSFDGVIGAFALTTDLLIIVVGLGLGAYFVRSFTIYLVQRQTLASLVYLEHGAYWAIAALAVCMFAALFHPVPDAVAGTVSLFFIGAAYLSSVRARKHSSHTQG